MKILCIEDDPVVARAVGRGLGAHGHVVLIAKSGEDGLIQARTAACDLILLDIGLPDQDGHQILSRLRALDRDVPVIVLTGRGELESKVSALNGGADDYVTKPFALDELSARIHALIRRTNPQQTRWIEIGDLRLDVRTNQVWRDDHPIELSPREFALLEYFVGSMGRVLSRQDIRATVWNEELEAGSNVVDVYVRYLRSKLDRPSEPSHIVTVRGSGYRFVPLPQPQHLDVAVPDHLDEQLTP